MFKVASSMPGAEKLVRHLHAHNIPIAVCTGSNQVNLGLKTTKHKDMFTLFHHVVTCSDDPQVQFGKPHPQPFQVTLSRLEAINSERELFFFLEVEFSCDIKISAALVVQHERSRLKNSLDLQKKTLAQQIFSVWNVRIYC